MLKCTIDTLKISNPFHSSSRLLNILQRPKQKKQIFYKLRQWQVASVPVLPQWRHLHLSPGDPRLAAYAARARAELRHLEAELVAGRGGGAVGRRRGQLAGTVQLLDLLDRLAEERRQLQELCADPELRELAELDAARLEADAESALTELESRLAGAAAADACSALLEVTAGVGGQEAMLFAAELLDMYECWAQRRGWRMEVAQHETTGLGGVRYAAATVHGEGVYSRLKYEGGVHRVQRVPRTEKGGRLHTSTVAVAVLPLPEAVDVHLPAGDLKIETKKASGAGGQHVNTTDSAVRVVHLPTGLAVECQEMRSQHRNKERALELLRARLYQRQLDKAEAERAAARKQQVGSSSRSEKIRTYNFPQDRVTDHRLGLSLHGLPLVLAGERLDEIHDRLEDEARRQRLLDELEAPADAS
ncbi:peptide chain release factor 1-like [Amphibalanus amphitrite]|uniref:peptide chain release factor 1-like n=1 Tax=Amphibalanus amphitrite TaxID=1232801 RepID=UPI001C91A6EE|nr:peptide chain release factor 1-like [Amphibalanus amphitrite]XP_043205436.1 peptide chain release factor 1-like [Amphibalanus amphitrite]XP_043205437.1 peptide chain release factor 1-like [Amphibalanus amphitrite]XP_043205438.1 peptide chain release factor 1-like [Amphibalanus amphitrite]XP_043205439.1 peptide chain release factor 1-like [Amphibalanus amphitrite]XP_043205919.1 peptide chain release factor 1-like [Amphibalanus amphitrite]XP_043205920.1 peptide chain release factor 1-like [A